MKDYDAKKGLAEYSKHLGDQINSILKSIPDVKTYRLEEFKSSKFYIYKFDDLKNRPDNFNENSLVEFKKLLDNKSNVVLILKRENSLATINERSKELMLLRVKIKKEKDTQKEKYLVKVLENREFMLALPPGLDIRIYNKDLFDNKPTKIIANSFSSEAVDEFEMIKKRLRRFRGEMLYYALDDEKINPNYLATYFNNPLGKNTLLKFQIDQYPDYGIKNIKNALIHVTNAENQKLIASIDELSWKITHGINKIQNQSKFNLASKQIEEKFYRILKEIKELTPAEKALRDINKDEGRSLEYKSSLELQTETTKEFKIGTRNINLVIPVLKTINAFLNSSNGGKLYIGVRDHDKKIIGIDDELKLFHLDKKTSKPSQDKFKLAFYQKLDNRLSENYRKYIRTDFIDIGEKTILLIDVKPSKDIVFLDNEKIYERTGPRTVEVKGKRLQSFFEERQDR